MMTQPTSMVTPLQRIRRHHALEHATLHVLTRMNPYQSLMGYSDAGGFWIVGNVSPEMLREAVEEALTRLKNGEGQLAIHPNCGTNFAVAGILAGTAAWLSTAFNRDEDHRRIDNLPGMAVAATLAIILAQPLGFLLQRRVTTDCRPGAMRVVEIKIYQTRLTQIQRVILQHTS